MNWILAVNLVVTTLAAIVVAVATVMYTRATVRIFESQIDPELDIDFTGDINQNEIEIRNDAGCTITDLDVSICVGHFHEGKPYPITRCIYTESWGKIRQGDTVRSKTPPISKEALLRDKMPNGVTVDPSSLRIEYSFIRLADKRRYRFGQRIGILSKSEGSFFYFLVGVPEKLKSMKKLIVKRIEENESIAPNPPPKQT